MSRFSRHWAAVAATLLLSLAADATPQESPVPIGNLLDRLAFRSIGPATMGGRVDDLAVLESHPSTFYAGVATGGLWRTTSNGTTWQSVFDNQEVVSIGAVAVPADDANLVWVGTGENNNRQSSSWGGGVFRSTDAGKTWKNMGLADSRHFGRILIDPASHDVVYVAAMGHLWGPNKERGVYKTTDGGTTWNQVLSVDENTGATDLAMDPSNHMVLYAAMYQRQRTAWGYNGGGPGSGIYKSTDAGKTWNKLTNGIPAGPLGRIGLDIYRSNPKIVYALIQHESESGVYRSDDAGEHWAKMSSNDPRPMYFSKVRVDPNDVRRIYTVGTRLMVSDDEGKTFREARVNFTRPGGERQRDDLDIHALWIDPKDSSHLILGCDVGLAASYDRAATWDYIDNLPIGQFYHVGYDMDSPYRVYGGLQDNDVWGGPSAIRYRFGIGNRDWFTLSIGDGFVAFADPRDARSVYAETQDGNLVRADRDSGERQSIRPQAQRGEPPLHWAWNTPMILSPNNPNTILIGANRVFRSPDRGITWEAISPDLTGAIDRDTLPIMGVVGKDIKISKHDGVSAYGTLVALAESPKRAGIYYAGADDGTVHVSRDAGKTWVNISGNFPGLAARAYTSRLVASGFDEATAYATFDNHRADDYTPYVYVSKDYGKTWVSLAATLPKGQVVNCLTEDPKNPAVLYLGTEFGLFVSFDKGQHWIRFKSNLPTVPVDEIVIHPRENDMLLATHGRSIWILDDITPIQRAAEASNSPAFLFDIRPATQFNPSNEYANYPGDRKFWGQNPEFGAFISYYLKDTPKDIRLTIRDANNAVVRDMSAEDLKNASGAGLNRIYWDLRHQPVEAPRPAGGRGGPGGGSGFMGGGMQGPFVLPGTYRATLTVNGAEAGTRQLRVQADPLWRTTAAELAQLHKTALSLHEAQRSMNDATAAITAASDQVRSVQEKLKALPNPPAAINEAADALSKRLAGFTQQLSGGGGRGGGRGQGGGEEQVRNMITGAKSQIMGSTLAPTAYAARAATEGLQQYAKLVSDLNNAVTTALPGLYKLLSDNKIDVPPLKPVAAVKFTLIP